jgi:cysteinyl-tRNA synthetase
MLHPKSPVYSLQQEALRCRLVARQHALALLSEGASAHDQAADSKEVNSALQSLSSELDRYRDSHVSDGAAHPLYDAVRQFHSRVKVALSHDESVKRSAIIDACDSLRDSFRDVGVQVSDSVQGKPKKATTGCRRRQPKPNTGKS